MADFRTTAFVSVLFLSITANFLSQAQVTFQPATIRPSPTPLPPPSTIAQWLARNTEIFGHRFSDQLTTVAALMQFSRDPVAFEALQNLTQLTNWRCVWRHVIDTLADDRNIFGHIAKNTRLGDDDFNLQKYQQGNRRDLIRFDEVLPFKFGYRNQDRFLTGLFFDVLRVLESSRSYDDWRIFTQKLQEYCVNNDGDGMKVYEAARAVERRFTKLSDIVRQKEYEKLQ